MDKCKRKNNLILIFTIMIVLAFAAIISTSEAFGATKGTVSDKAGLNVRKGPGTDYSVLYALSYGETFDVLATTNDKAGEKWYRIYARGQEGYVIAKYAKVEETDDYIYNKTFEENLTAQGFPESYKEYLRKLHAAHPKWVFKAQKTGLNWNDVIAKQSIVGRNLIHESYPDSWKSIGERTFSGTDRKSVV